MFPAREIHRLLAEAKRRKKTHRDVYQSLEKMQRKVRHLERLQVAPDVASKEARENTNVLAKKLRPYVYVLEALAEILDVPVNDVIYDAFKETSFNRTSNISHDDPIIELLLKLIEFCEAVVVNQSLSDYFQKGRNIGAEYNLVSGDFVRSKHPPFGSVEEGWDGGYEGAPETSWTRRASKRAAPAREPGSIQRASLCRAAIGCIQRIVGGGSRPNRFPRLELHIR